MKLAVVLYVRNEEDDIAEWLAFHHLMGFDHILVFDNLSNDRTRAVVRRAARFAPVTLLPWPIRDRRAQNGAYKLALWLLRGFDWVAFIDSDEFLVPTDADDVQTVLKGLAAFDAVAVNWRLFGSGGHVRAPGGLVIEDFTRRAEADFPENRIVKSIVRPRRVWLENPHRFGANGGYVTSAGKPADWAADDRTGTLDYTALAVHHYFTRSVEHWDRKMQRGYRDIVRPRSAFDYYDRNEVEDRSAVRFAPRVRAELKRRGQDKS